MERGSFQFFRKIMRPTFIFEWRDRDQDLKACRYGVLDVKGKDFTACRYGVPGVKGSRP